MKYCVSNDNAAAIANTFRVARAQYRCRRCTPTRRAGQSRRPAARLRSSFARRIRSELLLVRPRRRCSVLRVSHLRPVAVVTPSRNARFVSADTTRAPLFFQTAGPREFERWLGYRFEFRSAAVPPTTDSLRREHKKTAGTCVITRGGEGKTS